MQAKWLYMHKTCTRAGAHYSRMDFLSRRDSSHILFVYYQTKSDFITIIDSTSSELLSEVIKARQQVQVKTYQVYETKKALSTDVFWELDCFKVPDGATTKALSPKVAVVESDSGAQSKVLTKISTHDLDEREKD